MINSSGAVSALAFWFAAASGPFDNIERISPEVAAERVAKCGLGPVKVSYDELLQTEVLTVASATSATEGELVCIDKAASYYDVELPPNIQKQFNAIREARWSAVFLAEAQKWLSERGLLERVPKFVPGKTDEAAFTQELEKLCGPSAQGAFQSKYGLHALSPDWMRNLGMPLKPKNEEALSCLLNVTKVAGFEIGFIGNEAYHR